ncbi:MAG: energy transducer TonB [Sphingosinicella sp.]|nr:energy transducer TonB [Sphingosinicella sp.]
MRRQVFAAIVGICLGSATAQAQNLQERYEAAEKAFAAKEYDTAATVFAEVLSRLAKSQRDSTVEADLRRRIAETDLALGRPERAITTLTPAVSIYTKAPGQPFLMETYSLLGRAYEKLGEMHRAAENYQATLRLNTDPARKTALSIPLARAAVFTDAVLARSLVDAMIADFKPTEDKRRSGELLGEFQTLRGRIELNAGNHAEALEWFKKASKSAGGIGTRVSLSDVAIRSDLALASHLTGDDDKAFYYIAMTGAGRMGGKGPQFPDWRALKLPDCSPAFDIWPEDLVVFDIALGDDGHVMSAEPIYSTKPGKIEAEFVKAARTWLWSAEEMTKTEPFWRFSIRVATRCVFNTDRRWVGLGFMRELVKEVSTLRNPVLDVDSSADFKTLRAELVRREAADGTNSMNLIPVLVALAEHDEEGVYAERAREILGSNSISARSRAILDVLMARRQMGRGADALQMQPGAAWPSDVVDWFRIEQGLQLEKRKRGERAVPLYTAVFERGNAKTDTLAQFAALRLASIAYAGKAQERASGYLAATGLRPDQCALVDTSPIPESTGASSSDYPREAMNWGFEGYMVSNYDIGVDGKTKSPRVVFAYPPFVFEDTMERIISRWRFKPIYREGEQIGCTGATQSIRFNIPGKS